jgi:hypothetical protein
VFFENNVRRFLLDFVATIYLVMISFISQQETVVLKMEMSMRTSEII